VYAARRGVFSDRAGQIKFRAADAEAGPMPHEFDAVA